ncbi:MAG: hypothetical protein F6K47_21680 [Symploca sp. SIO2E6]|nr:hypothetical protein [Symploca sp. SIO2E6]
MARINASFGLTHYSLLITHYFLKQTLRNWLGLTERWLVKGAPTPILWLCYHHYQISDRSEETRE